MTEAGYAYGRYWGRLIVIGLALGFVQSVPAEEQRRNKLERVYQMYAQYKTDNFPQVEDISVGEAMQLASEGRVQFIDTRTQQEMAVSMLPGAISHRQFLDNRQHTPSKVIVVYCTISYRSGVLAKEMKSDGVRVKNLKGGLLAWMLEGGRMYAGNRPVYRVHVYGTEWDLAPSPYETVTFGFWQRLVANR